MEVRFKLFLFDLFIVYNQHRIPIPKNLGTQRMFLMLSPISLHPLEIIYNTC